MGHINVLASVNGDSSSVTTQQQQLLDLELLDIEFAEPTSVLDLTPCISPPLPADVWAERKIQFLVEEQHAKTQQAWEQQQQHLLHWEHQQHLQLLRSNWEHQEQIQSEQASFSTSMDEHVAMVWEMDDQQQHPVLDCWSFPSESDLSLEDLSSPTFPCLAMDDNFLNMDTWIPGSDGSSITDDHESSTARVDLDKSSSSSSCVNGSTDAASSQISPPTTHQSARELMQNVVNASDCDTTKLHYDNEDTAIDNAIDASSVQASPCSPMLQFRQQKRKAEENYSFEVCPSPNLRHKVNPPVDAPVQRWGQSSYEHELTPHNLQPFVMDPELQASEASPDPSKAHQIYYQNHAISSYQLQSGQTMSCVPKAGAPAAKNILLKARTKLCSSSFIEALDSTSSFWQSFGSADFPGLGDASPSPAGAGAFHGGMITTQLGIAQGVGRMGVESRNTRVRMDSETTLASGRGNSLRAIPDNAYRTESQNFHGGSGSGGVQIVHLLLACAEAVACRDSRQAALLLQQLQHMASPYGDSMQRVASCFVEGLKARLTITGSQPCNSFPLSRRPPNEVEKLEGFHLMYRACPYVAFGHYAANCAILDAFEGEHALHIIDIGMTHALQWPDLINRLANRTCGPPTLLRITVFGLSTEIMMDETGQELAHCAKLYNIPFEFRVVRESLENLQPSMLELREGEALAVNSMLQLHCVVKESRGSLNAVLQSIHELSPRILTLVEQNASHNGPFFLGRFMEALHYYSAIFDSLDAVLPRQSHQRVKMEQLYFGEEIKNIVSCEGPARVERHERIDQWRRRMSRAGFQPHSLKFLNEARSWLSQYACDGYTLTEEKGCLVLGWRGKPLVAASSWRC